MATPDKQVDVLIVGAGPAGLMLAVQLLRYGVRPTIIDKQPGPEKRAKTVMLHARALEIFRQIGMSDALLEAGVPSYGIQLRGPAGVGTAINFGQEDPPITPFPFILHVGQDQVARLLINKLTDNACPVIWDTELADIRQDDHAAQVQVRYRGQLQQWQCAWVVGADGTQSAVRNGLGIALEKRRQQQSLLVADLQLQDEVSRKIHVLLSNNGFLSFFPLATPGRFRLLFSLPEDFNEATESYHGRVNEELSRMLGVMLPAGAWKWWTVIKSQSQIANAFSQQRSFLIGDAAHTYSPIGAQGMNAGLHDAANLAWKLAGVLRGEIAVRTLGSYSQERLFLARPSLSRMDRLFGLLTASTPVKRFLRNRFFVGGIGFLERNRKSHRLFEAIAQLGLHYRRSALSAHHANSRHIQAGDRVPFLSVYNEKTKTRTDLHRWCEKPGFTLLIMGTIDHHQLHIVGRWMRQKYPREMHLYYLPYSPRNSDVFNRFELRPTATRIVLIRPDMHIGYMNDTLNVNLIDTYMEEILGWKYLDQ